MKNTNKINIISIDELKKGLPNYSPKKADEFHLESAKLANMLFDEELKKIKNERIILMCGGSASGKTEFIEKFFIPNFSNFNGIIFDSTLSTAEGVKIKIKKIKKSGNKPEICLILPNNLKRAFAAFHKRDRKIPEYRFYETHCGSREVALFVAKNYPDIPIAVYSSFYYSDNITEHLLFMPIRAQNIKSLLTKILLSKALIKKDIRSKKDSDLLASLGYKFLYKKL